MLCSSHEHTIEEDAENGCNQYHQIQINETEGLCNPHICAGFMLLLRREHCMKHRGQVGSHKVHRAARVYLRCRLRERGEITLRIVSQLFFPPPSPGEGPLTATKTSAPPRGWANRAALGFSTHLGLGFVRHPLKFIEICKFNGFP